MDVQCTTFVPTGYERWAETNDSELPMAFLTSEDLLSGVRELEPAIFITFPIGSEGFLWSRRQYVQRGKIAD